MNTILWILQSLMACAFFVPGIYKLISSKERLIEKGMSGVEGLSLPLIRFIGIAEVLGAIGIILPLMLNFLPVLTAVSAIGFALIMILAGVINYQRHEYKKIAANVIIFLICIFIAYGRIALTS